MSAYPEPADDQLASIFHLKGQQFPENQSAQDTLGFVNLLQHHCSQMKELPSCGNLFRQCDWRSSLIAACGVMQDSRSVKWLPEYGCALLAIPMTKVSDGPAVRRYLSIVVLDEWKLKTHWISSSSGRDILQHGSVPGDDRIVDGGDIAEDKWDDLYEAFKKVQQEASTKKGHHFTPAMIDAMLIDAHALRSDGLSASKPFPRSAPHGGFTDVGPRTGPRDRAWPLVCNVLQELLHSNPGWGEGCVQVNPDDISVFSLVVQIDLKLTLVEGFIAIQRGTPKELNKAMEMLQAIVYSAGKLHDSGYTLGMVKSRIEKARENIDQSAALRAEHIADQYKLGDFAVTRSSSIHQEDVIRLPRIVMTVPPSHSMAKSNALELAKARSVQNLSPLPEFDCAEQTLTKTSIHHTIAWITHCSLAPRKGILQAQLVLHEVERLFFTTASKGCIEDAAASLGPGNLAEMIKLIHYYRRVLDKFLESEAGRGRMTVEMRSRERLVSWIGYTVAFSVTRIEWPEVMQGYGVCLSPDDLRYLVLSDRDSREAMLQVATYLRCNTLNGKPIFSLVDNGDSTFGLAAKIGMASSKLTQIWEDEVEADKKRQANHWEEVMRKKLECARLRLEIDRLETILKTRKEALEAATTAQKDICMGYFCHRSNNRKCWCTKVNDAQCAFSSTEGDITKTKLQLESASVVQPVLQPLPEMKTSALSVIFFLYMTEEFRALSSLSFMGQQMMLPRTREADVEVAECNNSWLSYYNENQTSRYHTVTYKRQGEDGDVMLGMFGEIGKPERRVDSCTTPNDGVWYPDDVAPGRMMWRGGRYEGDCRKSNFNPFSKKILSKWIVEKSSEQLEERSLQWAMPQDGFDKTNRNRGNLAIASQCEATSWLTKVEYLTFGSMRAYPLLQLRKLTVALREHALPLDHPDVQRLIRQALFHVGEVSRSTPSTLLWRTEETDIFAALFDELEVRAKKIEHTPRDHGSLQLLVEIACYVGDWHNECKQLVLSHFAQIPWEWANEVDHQIVEAEARMYLIGDAETHASRDTVVSLRARQYYYYMYGVLCFGGSASLSTADVARLCEFQTLAHSGRNFAQEGDLQDTQEFLHVQALNVLARRASEIMEYARHDCNFITKAVANTLENIPPQLTWMHLPSTSACYEAEFQGHLYSANLLTGEVLFDGMPPSWLPQEVISNAVFKRTFGTSNFDVTMTHDGVFTTARAIDGRLYEFSLMGTARQLVIKEIEQEGVHLELLSHDGEWSQDIPVRLRNLHSHWLCREQEVIVVRPKYFRQREVDYIGRYHTTTGLASIYRVPSHGRGDSWAKLLGETAGTKLDCSTQFDKLVLVDSSHPIASVLSKFERLSEILTFLKEDSKLLFELPRFQFHFLVDSNPRQEGGGSRSGVKCLEYRGYQLASCQQLSHTLLEFMRYLVLEPWTNGDTTRIVVPQGRVIVREGKSPLVTVDNPNEDKSETNLRVHCYELHPRWRGLQADGISARLQLAALFVASGTLLPDLRAGMTGSEKAMELVRQCFVNHPLPQGERDQLVRIMELSGHNAALAIICDDLLKRLPGVQFPA